MTTDKTELSTAASLLARKRGAPVVPERPAASAPTEIQTIPLEMIDESDRFRLRQPPYPDIPALAEEIERFNQTTPLFVRPREDGYELISGYRRFAALTLLARPNALCRVYRDLSDEDAYDLAISENQDRESLTDLERGEICYRLQREGKTLEQIAKRMGWSSPRSVTNHLRLARESSDALRAALQGRSVGLYIALALLDCKTAELGVEKEKDTIKTIVENEMSVREARAFVARTRAAAKRAGHTGSETDDDRPQYIREFKNGAFIVNARLDPSEPAKLDDAIASLEDALKRARQLKRKIKTSASDRILVLGSPTGSHE
jgi:ParB family chromosome partitioning protein